MKKYAAELLTIFLGVALAFLAEDWREYRGDRAEEARLLVALAADFEVNAGQRNARMRWQTRANEALAELDRILAETPVGTRIQVADTLLTATYYAATYDPVRGNLDALLSAGRIAIIQDEAVRAAIAEWPRYLADALEDQTGQRRFVDDRMVPHLMEAGVPVRPLVDMHLDFIRGRLPDEQKAGTTAVVVTQKWRDIVRLRRFVADLALIDMGLLADHEEEVRALLAGGGAPGG